MHVGPELQKARTIAVNAGDDPPVLCLLCTAIITAGDEHKLRVAHNALTCEPTPYIQVRQGAGEFPLEARIGRAVYYELVALAVPGCCAGRKSLGVWSSGTFFPLGDLPTCEA